MMMTMITTTIDVLLMCYSRSRYSGRRDGHRPSTEPVDWRQLKPDDIHIPDRMTNASRDRVTATVESDRPLFPDLLAGVREFCVDLAVLTTKRRTLQIEVNSVAGISLDGVAPVFGVPQNCRTTIFHRICTFILQCAGTRHLYFTHEWLETG